MFILPKSLTQRQYWYNILGWLRNVSIKNTEWRELLIDDGRNTLSIEWEFNSKWDLEAALDNPSYQEEGIQKFLNFFETASNAYYYGMIEHSVSKSLHMPVSILHHTHGKLFYNVHRQFTQNPWEFAKSDREISSNTFKPVKPHLIEGAIQSLMQVFALKNVTFLEKIAFFHVAFEHIHPYPDGNGRVGRIALNTLLIMAGFPNIAIKWIKKEDRDIYYQALQACDGEVEKWLSGKKLWDLDFSATRLFRNIIVDGLKRSMDIVICQRFEEKKPLMLARDVAVLLGKNPSTFAVQCTNKAFINVVRGHKAYTHPELCVVEGL